MSPELEAGAGAIVVGEVGANEAPTRNPDDVRKIAANNTNPMECLIVVSNACGRSCSPSSSAVFVTSSSPIIARQQERHRMTNASEFSAPMRADGSWHLRYLRKRFLIDPPLTNEISGLKPARLRYRVEADISVGNWTKVSCSA
ncbi:hypothetical protein [Paraburkholderia rhizosphaerae]|uniref:hypothetical protein n=1 Tax=Paraburkholderia rhizosphaerae TaxID=480658 RepID=UPI001064E107|nr:hypothetical protein [Paraburkholderia rhizosphaerae]